ncbi:hypothetical protein F5Y05DRAFT_423351 [Hypoxylon sp. FL0543]|nr:hypothetical protein F5Y05DRAFT_423351 [Hypoxylon sp. FL0543]
MQFNYGILLLAAQALSVFASPAPPADSCGALGTVDITSLPEGVDASKVRQCNEHPLGDENASVAERDVAGDLFKRECWYGNPSGCTNGYCWKTCGDGPWCWTAREGGFGDWYTCTTDADCKTSFACGQSAGGKSCKKCGCKC